MSNSDLIERVMDTFLHEMEGQLRAMSRDLVALEGEESDTRRADLVAALLRAAHNLKGAAHMVEQPTIEASCHEMEWLLTSGHEGARAPIERLLAVVDTLREAGARLRAERDQDGPRSGRGSALPESRAHQPVLASLMSAPPPLSAPERSLGSQRAAAIPRGAAQDPGRATPRHFVYVAAEKLDALLARSEEILVARRSGDRRDDEVATIRDFVRAWEVEWRSFAKELGRLERKEPDHTDTGSPLPSPGGRGPAPALSPRAARGIAAIDDNLRRLQRDLSHLSAGLGEDRRRLAAVAAPLDEEVRRIRMIPFSEACAGLDRVARDLAKSSGKDVELILEGGEVELDRAVIDRLRDPLLHLVRNAVDHGVEPIVDRLAAGKQPRARVVVSAKLRGARVEIVVSDDGRGLDAVAIRKKARAMGLAEPEGDDALARIILLPRFSTASVVSGVSGRGVGLDVVKTAVEQLRGSVELGFLAGEGARFALTVPLTLSMVRVLLVSCAGQTFALDCNHVERVIAVRAGELRAVDDRLTFSTGMDGPPLPAAWLADLLDIDGAGATSPEGRAQGVVLTAGGERMVVLVDELLDEREAIVKSLGARIRCSRFASGATILPSGRIALVLLASSLVARGRGRIAPPKGGAPGGSAPRSRPRVLVVDDAFTVRSVQKSILEGAGFEVTLAPDGAEAWALLQRHPFDVVVSDVEMPGMDGFALVEAIRRSDRTRSLPIILVTSRGSEGDRLRGIQSGANAYLVKSAFDQELMLGAIRRLL